VPVTSFLVWHSPLKIRISLFCMVFDGIRKEFQRVVENFFVGDTLIYK